MAKRIKYKLSEIESYCDEHYYIKLTRLLTRYHGGQKITFCPYCGKFEWDAVGGIRAYDKALIGARGKKA